MQLIQFVLATGIVRPMVAQAASPEVPDSSASGKVPVSPWDTHQLRADEKYVFIDREAGEGFGFRLRQTYTNHFQVLL